MDVRPWVLAVWFLVGAACLLWEWRGQRHE